MGQSDMSLSEAIEAVRSELRIAQESGRGEDVRFSVGVVEIEMTVAVEKTAGGEASVKVLNLLSLGGSGEVSKAETNKVKVVLNPIGIGGAPLEVASGHGHRPDGS